MQVKNKQSGEVETMRYGAATAAVSAGTHEHVSVDQGAVVEDPSAESADTADLNAMTKDELVAEADRRGVEVKAGDTKAHIIKALEAK